MSIPPSRASTSSTFGFSSLAGAAAPAAAAAGAAPPAATAIEKTRAKQFICGLELK